MEQQKIRVTIEKNGKAESYIIGRGETTDNLFKWLKFKINHSNRITDGGINTHE
jgi:hypothetical protein